MPLNNLLNAAMNANRGRQAPSNPGEYANRMDAQRAQGDNVGGMGGADRLRREIEMIKRKIMDYKVQAARDPNIAGEMDARISYAMEKLARLEDSLDKNYGDTAKSDHMAQMEGQAEKAQMRKEQEQDVRTQRKEDFAKSQEQAAGGQGAAGAAGGQQGGEVAPGGMTKEQWGGMDRNARAAFMKKLQYQSNMQGVPMAGLPWWMTLDYGAEQTQPEARSQAGFGGGGEQSYADKFRSKFGRWAGK